VVFSDIDHYVQSLIASQANWVVQEGKLKKGSFIKLKSFTANVVKGNK
jgi:replication factor A1